MKWFRVTGFTKHNVWSTVEVKTIKECIPMRVTENGIEEITNIEEVK